MQQQETEDNQDHASPHQEQPRTCNNSPIRQHGYESFSSPPPSPNEGPFCMYRETHIKDGVNQCKNSLIGKILSDRPILKPILQNTLQGIWGNPKGFTITETEGGSFHITMESDTYLHRAVKGNPWTIRNSWFMVHYWDRKINPNNMDFKHVQV
jgi:hypothetical protein